MNPISFMTRNPILQPARKECRAKIQAWWPLILLVALSRVASICDATPRYQELVGAPPAPTEMAFKEWLDKLVGLRLQSSPLNREQTYYFAQDGDDETGDGSIRAPWKSLDKAQGVLNRYAQSGNFKGLCLRFRSGDIWRAHSTLTAPVAQIEGNRVRLPTPLAWVPQPNFVYELRGGDARERVEVKSVDISTGDIFLTASPLSTRHEAFVMECGLMIASPHVSVTSYEVAGTPSRSKPQFTLFQATTGWQDANARGDELSQAYTLEITEPVAWMRKADALDDNFRRVTSPAQVDEYAGTWYWDGKRIWAHEILGTPMFGGLSSYEVVYENRLDGICVADVDDVRIDNIALDGWGMTAQPNGTGDQRQYTGYGFRSGASRGNHVVLTRCESYYNNRHCFGNVNPFEGGIWTVAWCSWGYCVEGGSAVSYAWGGQNESIFYQCVNRAGSVQHGAAPYRGNMATAGYSHHGHTSGGTNKMALFISYGCHNVASPNMAGHCGPVDLPVADDIRACRAFVVEDSFVTRTPNILDRTKPSIDRGAGLMRPGLANDTVYINCQFEHSLLWANGNWVPILDGNYRNTRLLNCVLTYVSMADDYYQSTPNVSWEVSGLQAYNSHFDANLQTGRSSGYVGKSSVTAANIFKNCILSFRGVDYADPLTVMQMRCINDSSHLQNNCYSGFTVRDGPNGYDGDLWAVEIPAVQVGARVEADSLLASSHTQLIDGLYLLEYDMAWRHRYPVRTAIGPVESWPALNLPPILKVNLERLNGFPLVSVFASRPCDIWLEVNEALAGTNRWNEVGPFHLHTSPMVFIDPTPMTNRSRAYRVRGL